MELDNKELRKLEKKYVTENRFLDEDSAEKLEGEFRGVVEGMDSGIVDQKVIDEVVGKSSWEHCDKITGMLVESLLPLLRKGADDLNRSADVKTHKLLPRWLISHQRSWKARETENRNGPPTQ